MAEDRADAFLRMIRLSRRGRLKVYLGYSAGVGKTYQMLQEGHRLKNGGIDVVIGLLETHGREDISRLAVGLEVVSRRREDYHGIAVEEMDVDALLARKPQVALIDELAHTNAPGSRNAKRYEDVQDILAAGIHVITTMNVQHLESLYNIVENAIGVKVRERLPDSVLAEADEIVDVDLATQDLRKRLEEGKVYPRERIQTALGNFFIPSNLEKLRELTLRELASQIDLRRREAREEGNGATSDQIMVCLSSHGPNSEKLLRYGSRLAGKLNRNWYAVYVQTPSEEATMIDAQTQRFLAETLTLAKQLGAMVFSYKGEDVADTILGFAREYRVGHIVIGKSRPKPFWKRFGKNADVTGSLIKKACGITIIMLDTCEASAAFPARMPENTADKAPAARPEVEAPAKAAVPPLLTGWLTVKHILVWDEPVTKNKVLQTMAAALARDSGITDGEGLFQAILEREKQGSTFFNEGVAFPHVRINGLSAPLIALGLTKGGVADVSTEKPIKIVFLILSPAQSPDTQVILLGLASRAAQNRILLQAIMSAPTPGEVLESIKAWESGACVERAKK
ncbi:MAG: PTS sugar transporter subunit IIA [Candidatus Aminicenantales bacterium]